ncbi:hypothetical protein O9X80_11200 [Agrobacterium salinitolerans]|uniref:Uncharacterized protein n=1 Tax=Agrobacterium salinitolerans TaxID=1183413 RepID=A0A9X3KKS3_9HYPH|nr:hypothetical protein [Agrobacterium salinitolerans]MCZ7936674.1 hypothetical protein [Agrobacterium salinitolerans]MCZ7975054.1 hypothetical protein [Agrobacterium salinitolerans]
MRINSISNIDDKSNLRTTLNLVIRQVSDTTGEVTLGTGTTTVVTNPKISPQSFVLVQGKNATGNSAGAYVSSTGTGTFTITHVAGAAGRVVGFAVIGAA